MNWWFMLACGVKHLYQTGVFEDIESKVDSLFSGSNENNFTVICPHCDREVKIESEGQWNCPYCKEIFTYGNYSDNQAIFFITINSMLGKMAKADGFVSEKEIAIVTDFYDEIEFSSADKKSAKKIFNTAKSDSVNIHDYARQYSEVVPIEMCEMIYSLLWDIALADGGLHTNEEKILKNITSYLNLPETRFEEFYNVYHTNNQIDINDYYLILDCTAQNSDHEIKMKYREKIIDYHPDKIQAMGLPEEFVNLANEQMIKFNKAYEMIKYHRAK